MSATKAQGLEENVKGVIGLVMLAVIGWFAWGIMSGRAPSDSPQGSTPEAHAVSGDTIELKDVLFACKNEGNITRLIQVAASGDSSAAMAHVNSTALKGHCRFLQPGTKVFVEKVHVFSGIARVHAEGKPEPLFVAHGQLLKP